MQKEMYRIAKPLKRGKSEKGVRSVLNRRFAASDALFSLFLALVILCSAVFSACFNKREQNFEYKCVFGIECKTILNNLEKFDKEKLEILPESGFILENCEAGFNGGETVYDVFRRETRSRRIHTEVSRALGTGSVYIEGVGNIYEFDCGGGSGWLFTVNGVFPTGDCGSYKLRDGDAVCFIYTCDNGNDVGNKASNEN